MATLDELNNAPLALSNPNFAPRIDQENMGTVVKLTSADEMLPAM